MIKVFITFILISFASLNALACSCYTSWNNSFSKAVRITEFVALARVVSIDEYLQDDIYGFDGKMPYSMTVHIIKKYKGRELRKEIKIYGDPGFLC